MNKGIKMAKGKWLYFLGSDDRLMNNEVLTTIFEETVHSEIDLIVGHIKYDCNTKQASHLNKNGDVRKSIWSSRLWLTNSIHHQGVFYRRSIFANQKYSLNYETLADYDLNLKLFRQNKAVNIVDVVIALCGANGLSKNYKWSMYKQEIELKTQQSSLLMKPLFYVLAFLKYLAKKIQD